MLQYTRLIVGGQSAAIEESSCWRGEMKVLWWKHRTSSVKIDVFSMQQVQTHSASTERGSVESLCLVQDLSGQPPALASEWKIWIRNWQYATRHSHYSLYLYIYIMFMVHVSCSPSYSISHITNLQWHALIPFLAADQGGIEKGGGPKWRFLTLSSQFPGKGQPPPPVLNEY